MPAKKSETFDVCIWDPEDANWAVHKKFKSLRAAIREHDALIASGDFEREDVAVMFDSQEITWGRRQDVGR